MMSVTPDPNTIISISRVTSEPDCSVCEKKAPEQTCNTQRLTLKDPTNTSVEFTCPQPQDVFSVEINREIGMKVTKIRIRWRRCLIFFFRWQQCLTVNLQHSQSLSVCQSAYVLFSTKSRLHRGLLFG